MWPPQRLELLHFRDSEALNIHRVREVPLNEEQNNEVTFFNQMQEQSESYSSVRLRIEDSLTTRLLLLKEQ